MIARDWVGQMRKGGSLGVVQVFKILSGGEIL